MRVLERNLICCLDVFTYLVEGNSSRSVLFRMVSGLLGEIAIAPATTK